MAARSSLLLETRMSWSVTDDTQRVVKLFRQAQSGPRRVYRRRELVAVVVGPAVVDRVRRRAEPPAVTLKHPPGRVRHVLAEDGHVLEPPTQRARDSGFGRDL
jgi:hypothetical protein